MAFLVLALLVAAMFFASALTCSDTRSEKSCSESGGTKVAITLVIGVIGFFVIRAIETSGRGGRVESAVATDPAPSLDPSLASLEKLADLRDRGVLTEEEFQRKKAELLDSS